MGHDTILHEKGNGDKPVLSKPAQKLRNAAMKFGDVGKLVVDYIDRRAEVSADHGRRLSGIENGIKGIEDDAGNARTFGKDAKDTVEAITGEGGRLTVAEENLSEAINILEDASNSLTSISIGVTEAVKAAIEGKVMAESELDRAQSVLSALDSEPGSEFELSSTSTRLLALFNGLASFARAQAQGVSDNLSILEKSLNTAVTGALVEGVVTQEELDGKKTAPERVSVLLSNLLTITKPIEESLGNSVSAAVAEGIVSDEELADKSVAAKAEVLLTKLVKRAKMVDNLLEMRRSFEVTVVQTSNTAEDEQISGPAEFVAYVARAIRKLYARTNDVANGSELAELRKEVESLRAELATSLEAINAATSTMAELISYMEVQAGVDTTEDS